MTNKDTWEDASGLTPDALAELKDMGYTGKDVIVIPRDLYDLIWSEMDINTDDC